MYARGGSLITGHLSIGLSSVFMEKHLANSMPSITILLVARKNRTLFLLTVEGFGCYRSQWDGCGSPLSAVSKSYLLLHRGMPQQFLEFHYRNESRLPMTIHSALATVLERKRRASQTPYLKHETTSEGNTIWRPYLI